ncbi:MAG: caspase family protein [Armatimonadota bacterium]
MLFILMLAFCFMITVKVVESAAQAKLVKPTLAPNILKLGTINRNQLLKQLNKPIQLEGYFYNGSIPMIVENMELIQSDTPLPPDKYVPLQGSIPSSFKPGARVKIGGLVQKPTGQELQDENAAIKLSSEMQSSIIAEPSASMLESTQLMTIIAPSLVATPAQGKRYALLIGGGKNQANDYIRYWNDLKMMYQIMLSKGYEPANIRVAYSNGYPKGAGMPVNFPATIPAIQAAFSYFVPKIKAEDSFYIFVAGQGAPPGTVAGTTVYWTWVNAPMTPMMFASQVNRILTYKEMTIQMSQSFSGGFIPVLARPKRVIITSSASNKEAYAHPSFLMGNFSLWSLSAYHGHFLLNGGAINADSNSNGNVSVAEAYNFSLGKPGIIPINAQMPQFEDNGVPPSRFGHIPVAGEGALGMVTNL